MRSSIQKILLNYFFDELKVKQDYKHNGALFLILKKSYKGILFLKNFYTNFRNNEEIWGIKKT